MNEQMDIREEIAKIRETQAVQGQVLNQIMQSLNQSVVATAQQTTQINTLVTDMAVLKVETQAHERRIATIETQTSAASKQDAADKITFTQWIVNNGLTILTFLAMLSVALINLIKH